MEIFLIGVVVVVVVLSLVALNIKHFLVSVPEVTGLLTVNVITGKMKPHGPGIHLRWPWEQIKDGLFINLRIVTESMEETYPSKDGPEMLVKWSFQYRPSVARIYDKKGMSPLERYISADDDTIKIGLKDVGSSILSADIAQLNSYESKAQQRSLENRLEKEFETLTPTPEELYGIELIRVSLADVDLEPEVQKVKASQVVATTLQKMATGIRVDHPEINPKDALNAAMIIDGKITKHVIEVEGEGGNALAALLVTALGGGKK